MKILSALLIAIISIIIYSMFKLIKAIDDNEVLRSKLNKRDIEINNFDKEKETVRLNHNREVNKLKLILENQLMITDISKRELLDIRKELTSNKKRLKSLTENTVSKDLYDNIINEITKLNIEVGLEDFIKLGKEVVDSSNGEVTGIYIIKNITKSEFYVGSSLGVYKEVVDTIENELSVEVCKAHQDGNEISVKILPMKDNEFNSIDRMKDYYINMYKAYSL